MIRFAGYKVFLMLFLLIFSLIFFTLGCNGGADGDDNGEVEKELNKGNVNLLYVDWECAKASTYIAAAVLEDKGYKVKTTRVNADIMWQRLADGEGDAITCAWLPLTHANYLKEAEGRVEELAINYSGPVSLGLVVPRYVAMDSIEEINDHLEKIGGLIIGIDPDSGIMAMARKAIDEYDLKVELTEGTDSVMTNALKTVIDRNDWIVITGWTPHWKFNEWDLKFLDDPKGVFGAEEYIATYGRLGLENDMPEVYAFLKNFQLDPEELSDVMLINSDSGLTLLESAKKWITGKEERISHWFPDRENI